MNNFQVLVKAISTGFRTDKRMQVEKESTQNPALEPHRRSPGTMVDYAQPVPTQIDFPDPYEMSPVNARHWASYLSAQQLAIPSYPHRVLPANVLTALANPQNAVTANPADVWRSMHNLSVMQQKGYSPSNSFYD